MIGQGLETSGKFTDGRAKFHLFVGIKLNRMKGKAEEKLLNYAKERTGRLILMRLGFLFMREDQNKAVLPLTCRLEGCASILRFS